MKKAGDEGMMIK